MSKRSGVAQLSLGEVTGATVYWVKKGICNCIDLATENGTEEVQKIASIMKETISRNGATTAIIKLCNEISDQIDQLNSNLLEVNNNIYTLISELLNMVSENAYYTELSNANKYASKYDSTKDTGGLMDEINKLVEAEKNYLDSFEEGKPVRNQNDVAFAKIYEAKLTNLKWVSNINYKEKVKKDGQIAYEVSFDVCDPRTIMESIELDASNLNALISRYKINISNEPAFVLENKKSLFDYAYDYCEKHFVTEAQYTEFYEYQLSYAIGIATNMLLYLRFYFEFCNASGAYNNNYALIEIYQKTYNTLVNAIIGTCSYVDIKVGCMMRNYDIKQKITMKYNEDYHFTYDSMLDKNIHVPFTNMYARNLGSIESKANKTKSSMEFCMMNVVGDSSYLILDRSYFVTEGDMGIGYKNDIKMGADEHYFIQSADYMNLLETQKGYYTIGKWQEGGTSSDISAFFCGKAPCAEGMASWLANECGLGTCVPNATRMLLSYYKQNRPKASAKAPVKTTYYSDKFYWQNVANLSFGSVFQARDEISARNLVEDNERKKQPLLVILHSKEKQQYSLIGGENEKELHNSVLVLSRREQFYPNDIVDVSRRSGFSYVESGISMYLSVSRLIMDEGSRVVLVSASTGEELTCIATYQDFKFNNCNEKIFRFRMPYQDTQIVWKSK